MTHRRFRLIAPSRLHFGLFSFGGDGRQFGGVGAMIERPGLELLVEPAAEFEVAGPLADRVRKFAGGWTRFHGLADPPACRLTICRAPREHVGLGTGTQVGLSVAAALFQFAGELRPSAMVLAASVGRGLRSAVGTYGFLDGGLVVERGKLTRETLSPLDVRVELPAEWRFALICPASTKVVFGDDERQAFEQLPAVPAAVSEQLVAEVRDRMLPAAVRSEFDDFSDSVFQFGRLAGSRFAARQGGPYNGPHLTALVDLMRSFGVRGVGQSSWGPTLFALLPNQSAADRFVQDLHGSQLAGDAEIEISPPNNSGARVATEG